MYLAAFISVKAVWKRGILLLGMILSCSCARFGGVDRMLTECESLMSSNPDSALAIISNVDVGTLSRKSQHARYALLMSMALDKNYIDIKEDSLAMIAFEYYRQHGSLRDKMLSGYYLGVVRQNAGNYLKAAVDFDNALSIAKKLEDYHYCGLSCRHLTTLHAYNFNHVLALEYAHKTTDYFEKCGETLSADYGRINEAGELIRNYRYDEALSIIDDVLVRNDYRPLLRLAYLLRAEALLYGEHDYKGAEKALSQVPEGNSDVDKLIRYGYYALINELKGEADIADAYLSKAKPLISSPYDSLLFYDQASRIYKKRGEYKNAYEVVSSAISIQNRQVATLLGQSVTHAMEQHYRDLLKNEKELSYKKTVSLCFILFFAVLLVSILLYIVWKMRQKSIRDMAEIDSLNIDIGSLTLRNEYFRKVTDSIVQDRVRLLNELADSYFDWSDEQMKKKEKNSGFQTKEEIISTFREQLGNLRADKRITENLEKAINYSKKGLMDRLRTTCGKSLKENDYKVIMLLFSGLSIRSIAFLTRMSEPAVRTRKTRYKHFFETLSQPEASDFIDGLNA